MFTAIRDDLIVIFATVVFGFLTIVHTVDVRLRDGQADNQGRVEVRRNGKGTWGKVCDINFGDEEAAVVCRQLNYKYSRNDKGVYMPDYPDYRLENLHCNGSESSLGDCIEGEWKTGTGICNVRTNAYASVCCSNSPDFGEMHNGSFVSDCADNWIDAEEICEEKKATLASFDEYKSILSGTIHTGTQDDDAEKGYWTKRFFTPWMWSNGCFEFKNESFDHQEFNLENNTAQACLQMCSIASPPSSFLLSENFCRCVPTTSLKSYITEVLPGWCNRKCLGDTTYFCGSGSRFYWSLYTIALESIFFKISDPGIIEHRQCAVLEASRKLSSEDCYKRYGYICGQILQENSSLPKLLYFQKSRFYEVYMLEARKKCTSDDTTMRLMGEKILEQDLKFSQQYLHLWVDISRLLTNVYAIYWEPENRKDTSLWRNLEPRWCSATIQRGVYYADEVTACQTRFRYICSMNNKRDHQNSNSNGSSSGGDKGTEYSHNNTEYNHNNTEYSRNNSITDVHEITTVPVYREQADNSSLKIIIIAAVCGIVIVVAIVVTLYIYRRSKKNGLQNFCCQKEDEYQEGNALENDYTATFNATNASPEHIYAEIKSENIYHEADTLLEHRDPDEKQDLDDSSPTDTKDDGNREPVTMKRSYSSPKDLVNLVEESEKQDLKDPDYIYPYDKVYRSEDETKSKEFDEPKAHEMGKNEIMDNQNKNTVV